ncbi:DUF7002 family protein [Sabulicella glaciei]|uniref:Uncharacterized protein n=1 Tax=Sabulicella glaciei TaxID=2984948 RepID=A0ABT3NY41_9PROT|nr:hypothetical protein [Roseococcus sp. MDT2-1-1]MCW8087035.1 hypothetical protein [Roseococcus sp. MDT2-1-1]
MSFAARHPSCWHVVEAEGLPRVAREGLLPAAEIMRRAGRVSHANRDGFVALEGAVLRFQQMRDDRLSRVLRGRFAGDPAAWRAHVDSHVFFWLSERRRDGFRAAAIRERRKAEPGAPELEILEFDTAALLEGVGDAAFFSRVNSGSMVMGAGRVLRDEALYQPVSAWTGGEAAELAIRGAVPPTLLRAALRGGSLPP